MNLEHQAVVDALNKQIKELESQVELKQELMQQQQVRWGVEMQQERARLEGEIERLSQELMKTQEQNEKDQDVLQVALMEKQRLEDAHSKLDDKYQEKEAQLEKALAHKYDLEEQLKKSRANHEHEVNQLQFQLTDQLHTERSELLWQIAKAKEDIAAWSRDCQAKTQQIKQYKRQEDQFQVQIDSMSAEIRDNRITFAEYEQQLEYYKERIQQLNDEDKEQRVSLLLYHTIIKFCCT